MTARDRPGPHCPTCGTQHPKPDRREEFNPDLAVELAKRILANLPVEPLDVIAQRRRDLLRDTGGYAELQEIHAVPVRGAGGVVKWVAA